MGFQKRNIALQNDCQLGSRRHDGTRSNKKTQNNNLRAGVLPPTSRTNTAAGVKWYSHLISRPIPPVVWDLRGKREVVALAYGGGAGTLAGRVGSRMAVGVRRGMSDIAWHPDNVSLYSLKTL